LTFSLAHFTAVKPPFALIAQRLSKALHLVVKPIYAPPKKFAAAIGFVFSVAISALLLTGNRPIANIVAEVLAAVCHAGVGLLHLRGMLCI
jgi:hypothetical protein